MAKSLINWSELHIPRFLDSTVHRDTTLVPEVSNARSNGLAPAPDHFRCLVAGIGSRRVAIHLHRALSLDDDHDFRQGYLFVLWLCTVGDLVVTESKWISETLVHGLVAPRFSLHTVRAGNWDRGPR